jgi:hypothetical protein
LAWDDPGRSIVWSSFVLGVLFLLSSLISIVFRLISPLDNIGSGDPLSSLFLLVIGLIFVRGAYLVQTGQEQGRGYALSAWLAGLLITVVVSLVWISGVAGSIIMTGGPGGDHVDITLITVLITGILSIVLSNPYRKILHGRGMESEKEVVEVC